MPEPHLRPRTGLFLFLMLSGSPCIAAASGTMAAPLSANSILRGAYDGAWGNDCEALRRPSIQRFDINRDGRIDALVHDQSECYRKFGGYFTIVARQQGRWRRIGYSLGKPKWLRTSSNGWPDFEVPDFSRDARCSQVWRFSGMEYYHSYLSETAPHQCRAQSDASASAVPSRKSGSLIFEGKPAPNVRSGSKADTTLMSTMGGKRTLVDTKFRDSEGLNQWEARGIRPQARGSPHLDSQLITDPGAGPVPE